MKKNNLIKITYLFLTVVLFSGFTIKNKKPQSFDNISINNNDDNIRELLVVYPFEIKMSKKIKIRKQITSNLGNSIININQCPSNPNIEIFVFLNTNFQKADTNGLYDDYDPDERSILNYFNSKKILSIVNKYNLKISTKITDCEIY